MIADTKAAVDEFVARMHDELIALIVEIVREILGSFEPDDFAARAVARALKDMRAGTTLMLMTAPEEAEAIRARLAALLDGDDRLTVVPDPQVAPGHCMLWSEFGQIDVSVDAQLQQLAFALHVAFEEAEP